MNPTATIAIPPFTHAVEIALRFSSLSQGLLTSVVPQYQMSLPRWQKPPLVAD